MNDIKAIIGAILITIAITCIALAIVISVPDKNVQLGDEQTHNCCCSCCEENNLQH